MMRMQEATVTTAGKGTAVVVSRTKCPLDRCWDDSCLPTNVQRLPFIVLVDDNSVAVTAQTLDRLDRQSRTTAITRERRLVNMNGHEVVIVGVSFIDAAEKV